MNRPKIFVGSSTEGRDLVYAIQQNLEHDADVTPWTQGVFQLSMPIISSLFTQLNIVDFAIFIFSPDDVTKIRGNQYSAVRDNVIFETGLFSGKLGYDRVYFLKPRRSPDLRLPSDLLGLLAGEYDSERSDGNMVAATGSFCNQVRQNMKRLGTFNHSVKADKEEYENDLRILFAYLEDKGWTNMSFQKIVENVHPKLTEEYLMRLIQIFPDRIRRSRIREGVYGIKWIKPNP